ncbi:MAG: hypothetical protein KKD44_04505 [Proteobacteria bacterium]|nr:hypothetical protein [Pseudomonadota bacterium]
MLDIAVSYNKYKFLGHEFLTWLWYVIARDQGAFTDSSGSSFSLIIGNRIVCENIVEDNTVETVIIKGDNAGLEEGLLALRKGSVVTELSLSLNYLEQHWEFNLKGENFHFTGFKHPETEKITKKEDREGALLEKIYLYSKAVELIDQVFSDFLKLRLSEKWKTDILNSMKVWIKA